MQTSGNTANSVQNTAGSHLPVYGLMLLATCFWAGNIVAAKEGLLGFAPFALAQLRVAGAAMLLGSFLLFWRRRLRLPCSVHEWLFLAVLASLGITGNQLCFVSGLARTSVLHAGLIAGLGPVIVLGVSILMRVEGLNFAKLTGMVISCGGVVLLLTQKTGGGAQTSARGDIIILVGTITFAIYTILEKKIAGRYDDLVLNAFVFGLGALLMLPFAASSVIEMHWTHVPLRAWWGLSFLIVCGSVIAYVIYAFALSELAASKVADFSYLQPIIVAVLAVVFSGEHISKMEIAAGALVLLGMYFACRRSTRHFHHLAHTGT